MHRVQGHSENEDKNINDVRKERMYELPKATAGNGRTTAPERGLVRQRPALMALTTSQQRTRSTMFG